MSDNFRKAALQEIATTQAIGGVVDYSESDVRSIYASHVFSQAVQRERLPKPVYKSLQKTIQAGHEITPEIADAVAQAMRDWAVEHGATHFTHWFQPMTGSTAEKHDSFINPTPDGEILAQFSGKELIRGEPDASSFPSGGLRATFEARGYTAWDPSSPAFILDNPNGSTLVIPTMFISWTGEALDKKTPLLRSMDAVNTQALRVLNLFGTETSRVLSTLGAEQEYFLVDKRLAALRPDLVTCGRTLFGAKPPKGQELDDNYFGAVPTRVLSYMAELEFELLKLGVPIKTRHNEVAPGQYELAPTFETTNLATDHQMLTMEVMRKVAERHGFICLMHEKPFAGVNGSGKHNNWALATGDGENLLNPGDNPHDNAQFLVFLAATCRAVYRHADLLRITAASAGNDHRLGANEAPPAIISVYLGRQLSDIFMQLKKGSAKSSKAAAAIQIGVSMLPPLPRDAGDRNRTSPFAFTGNKFEFRAVGSNQSVAAANTVLNTIMAESLDFVAARLEKEIAAGTDFNEAVQALLCEMVQEFEPILFDGDNYSDEWKREAAERGLPNLVSTVDAIPLIIAKKNVELFGAYSVYSERELASREEILLANYTTTLKIEALTASRMAHSLLLPAGIRYQGEVATVLNASKAAGINDASQKALLEDIAEAVSAFKSALSVLDKVIADAPEADALGGAKYQRETVLSSMDELRRWGDRLEILVAEDLWPLPSYTEMLFHR